MRSTADVGALSIEQLKEELPLQYVITQAGIGLKPVGERLMALCPFHEDSNPSFAVFGENLDYCGCWSCEFKGGDMLDFIQKKYGVEFGAALDYARKLLVAYREDPTYELLEVQQGEPGDPAKYAADMMEAYNNYKANPHALEELILEKGLDMPAEWIHENWWVGTRGNHEIVIPHPDENPTNVTITGYKTRYRGGHPYAVSGSRFPALYGAWRSANHDRVIVCEGESDTWWTSYVFRNQKVDVFGLPTGAGAVCRAEWQEQLNGKDVYLLPDGDRAGREFARRWSSALAGSARSVHVVVLPDEKDACKLTNTQLQKAVRAALKVEQFPVGVAEQSLGYIRNSNGLLISDWIFIPDRFLKLEDGFGFEGWITGRPQRTTISFLDMSSVKRLQSWAARHERHFFGTEKDAQHLSKLLELRRPFMSAGIGVDKVGWHEGAFVLPDSIIGNSQARYIHGDQTHILRKIIGIGRMETGAPSQLLPALLRLHDPKIIKPLMAWVAVSALRSLVREFPIFFMQGGAETGKTTLIRAVMSAFGYDGEENTLTNTTPYALAMLMSSSNGVPIWVDEYRLGAKEDAKKRLDQLVRDAWTASSSSRGGQGENLSKVVTTPASAPLIISGEDVFEETSLRQRSIRIQLPMDTTHRSAQALEEVLAGGEIGSLWLSWLVGHDVGIPVFDRTSRQATAVGVLEWGWGLLSRWAEEGYGVDLGEFEMQGVEDRTETEQIDPHIEALIWGLDQRDDQWRPLVKLDGDTVLVKTLDLNNAAKKAKIMLPGGHLAMANWMIEWAGDGHREKTAEGFHVLRLGGRAADELRKVIGIEEKDL